MSAPRPPRTARGAVPTGCESSACHCSRKARGTRAAGKATVPPARERRGGGLRRRLLRIMGRPGIHTKEVWAGKDRILCIALPSAHHCSRKARGTRAEKKAAVPPARKWRGGGERGQSAIRRPCAADAARDVRGRDGRYPDRALRAVSADGCRAREERRMRGGGARRRIATPRARANRGGERPRSGTNAAKRDATRSDRTRTQSHDCGEGRAQGVAPFSPGSTVGPFSATR